MCIWDMHTQLPTLPMLTGHTDRCSCITYSPDGKFIISGSWDKSIRVWSSQTGEQKFLFSDAHKAPIIALASDRQGQFFVSADKDGLVQSWTLEGRRSIFSCPSLHSINALRISVDGKSIICGTAGGQIVSWDVTSASSPKYSRVVSQLPIRSLVCSPSGKSIAITTGDERNTARGTLEFLDPQDGTRIGPPLISGCSMRDLDFSPDGTKVVASCHSTIRVWDVQTGKLLSCLSSPSILVKWSSDGQFIASATSTAQTLLWSVSNIMGQIFDPSAERPARAEQVVFSHDELTIAGGTRRGTIRLWDLSSSSERPPIRPSTSQLPVTCVAFESDGTLLCCGFKDGTVQVVIIKTSRSIFTQKVHQSRITALCFSSAGPFLASSSVDGSIQIWNYRSRSQSHVLDYLSTFHSAHRQPSHPNLLSFSNQGEILAASFDDRIILWNLSPTSSPASKLAEFNLEEHIIHLSFSSTDAGLWSSSFHSEPKYHSISQSSTSHESELTNDRPPVSYYIDKTGWVWQTPRKRLFQLPHQNADFFLFGSSGKLAYQANNLLRVIDFSNVLRS